MNLITHCVRISGGESKDWLLGTGRVCENDLMDGQGIGKSSLIKNGLWLADTMAISMWNHDNKTFH